MLCGCPCVMAVSDSNLVHVFSRGACSLRRKAAMGCAGGQAGVRAAQERCWPARKAISHPTKSQKGSHERNAASNPEHGALQRLLATVTWT